MDSYDRDVMAVAEAWLPPERAARYVAPDTLHQVFNFDFMGVPWDAGRMVTVIEGTMAGLAPVGAPATWALSNHDSPRVVSRLGDGELGLRRARALALLAHALPGAVYVYQGEELGLPDADLPDEARQDPVFRRTGGAQKGRDGARVPLPWSGDRPPYGFGSTRHTWLPQPAGWSESTVAAQEGDPTSTLAQYRTTLHLRRSLPALLGDEWSVVADDGLLVLRRGPGFACVVNCSARTREHRTTGRVLVASDRSVVLGAGALHLTPGTGAWLQQ
jgi:alpha-glucosidase